MSADSAYHMTAIAYEYARIELESQLKSLMNECEYALKDLRDGNKKLPSTIIQNKMMIDSNIAKYNMALDLLPSLRVATGVESTHGQQARDERLGSGGESGGPEPERDSDARSRRKPRS